LIGAYLTPNPSPAGIIGKRPKISLAGEGKYVKEGAKPPLIITPPLKQRKECFLNKICLRGGQGEII